MYVSRSANVRVHVCGCEYDKKGGKRGRARESQSRVSEVLFYFNTCPCGVVKNISSSGESEDIALENKFASFAKCHCRLDDLRRVKIFVFIGRDGGVQVRNESSYGQVVGMFVCRAE